MWLTNLFRRATPEQQAERRQLQAWRKLSRPVKVERLILSHLLKRMLRNSAATKAAENEAMDLSPAALKRRKRIAWLKSNAAVVVALRLARPIHQFYLCRCRPPLVRARRRLSLWALALALRWFRRLS